MAEIKEREIRLLEDRLKNLNMGLNEMGSENVMVNKEMLTAVRDYMAQLLGLLRRPAPENKALSMDELRKMHAQPVWVVPNKGVPKWYLVDVANDACKTCDMDVVDFELYGPENKSYGWLAYRRKPEED